MAASSLLRPPPSSALLPPPPSSLLRPPPSPLLRGVLRPSYTASLRHAAVEPHCNSPFLHESINQPSFKLNFPPSPQQQFLYLPHCTVVLPAVPPFLIEYHCKRCCQQKAPGTARRTRVKPQNYYHRQSCLPKPPSIREVNLILPGFPCATSPWRAVLVAAAAIKLAHLEDTEALSLAGVK